MFKNEPGFIISLMKPDQRYTVTEISSFDHTEY